MPEISSIVCPGDLCLVIPLTSVILYQIDPVLGIGFFSSQYVAELLQSTIHEWYHNPVRNRKSFYSFPVYWGCTFLERIGLASTRRHVEHHRHQLPTLDRVEVWLDLYLPFVEAMSGSTAWARRPRTPRWPTRALTGAPRSRDNARHFFTRS
jgi:hypothetical protein